MRFNFHFFQFFFLYPFRLDEIVKLFEIISQQIRKKIYKTLDENK
jgi:hypothetical protein